MIALKDISVFQNVSAEAIQWFKKTAQLKKTKKGDYIFKEGEPIEHMQVIVEGKAQFMLKQGGNMVPVTTVEAGQLGGLLPFSRMQKATGYVVILEDATYWELHKNKFQELGEVSPELMQNLVGYLSDRVRNFTQTQQQREKMASLGKLSAGLAHEINNPAAAINRTSEALREKIQMIPICTARLLDHKMTSEQLQAVTDMVAAKCKITGTADMTMMEKSAKEDALIDWMDEQGIEDSFDYAEVLLGANIEVEDLQQLADQLPQAAIGDALAWINTTIEAEKLTVEIHQASARISDLVGAIKTYSHMDRSPDLQTTHIHEGIDSTLTMLGHKLKSSQITITRNFKEDLSPILAHPGELNQVWTNLLDNAIDALNGSGNITITTFEEPDFVRVDITDSGPGIPSEVQGKIFDPFFTTKGVGKGSGLGLDIVQRIIKNHNADIKVRSKPGKTVFELCFPKK